MIAQDILNSARALIDELNVGGVVISSDDTDMKALELNGLYFINSALSEVYKVAQNIKEYEIDNTGATTDDIYTIFELPSDFGAISEIINLTLSQVLKYRLMGYNKMYVENTYLGKCTVFYNTIPTVVQLSTDEVILTNPIALQFVNNFVAARMATTENPQLVNYFEEKANELLFKSKTISPAEEEDIVDAYGFNNCNYRYPGGGYYG